MAGTDNLKAILLLCNGQTAKYGCRYLEDQLLGHDTTHGHYATHGDAANIASQAVTAPLLDAPLATLLAALDARYHAGSHAGPLMSRTTIRNAILEAVKAGAYGVIQGHETEHGHARALAAAAAGGDFVADVVANLAGGATLNGTIDAFLTDLDARYNAGTCATAPGVVMAGFETACETAARQAAVAASNVVETGEGHFGHAAIHAIGADLYAVARCGVTVAPLMAAILAAFDARYAAHA